MTRKRLTHKEAERAFGQVPNWMEIEALDEADSHALDTNTYNVTVRGCLPSQVYKLIHFTKSTKF